MVESEVFKKLGRHPELLKRARVILKTNDLYTYISKFFPMIPKVGFSVDWHQDNFYIKADPTKLISCDVFVNGATKENGCLRIAPRSHTKGVFNHNKKDKHFTWLNINPEVEIIDLELEEPFAVLFHPNLAHGCYRNTSNQYRYSIAWEYIKAGYQIPDYHNQNYYNDLLEV